MEGEPTYWPDEAPTWSMTTPGGGGKSAAKATRVRPKTRDSVPTKRAVDMSG